ncbi:HET-domain-containing protein, partial [Linderina pennispora]
MGAFVINSEKSVEIKLVKIEYDAVEDLYKVDNYSRIESMSILKAMRKRYYAVSYTWGDVTPWTMEYINCNNGEVVPLDSEIVSFNYESYCKIHHIILKLGRDMSIEDRPKYFWIDAICINQDDKREKKTMISTMDKIFKGADKILAIPDLGTDDYENMVDDELYKNLECDPSND